MKITAKMAVDLEDKSAAFLLQEGRRIIKVIGKRIRYFREPFFM